MKRLLLLAFFAPALLFGQESTPPTSSDKDGDKKNSGNYKWEIGVNGGVNITNVSGLNEPGLASRWGRLYGLTLTYHKNRWLAVKTDFDFENKGWTIDNFQVETTNPLGGIDVSNQDIHQYLDYFDIPAFLHIGFGKKVKFDLNFGPYFAFLVNNEAFYYDTDGKQVFLDNSALTDFSSVDWGLTYGGGIDYAISKRFSLGFDLLYEHGLKTIREGGLKKYIY